MTVTSKPLSGRHDSASWWGGSLAYGAAGIALLHIEHARNGSGRWATVQAWATTMTRTPVSADPDSCGLYQGAPAVAFALHAAGQPAYDTALTVLDDHVTAMTRARLDRAHQRIDDQRLPALREFDLISGMTGLGAYLLHRHPGGALLSDVLTYLVRLTEPLDTTDGRLPGWWSSDGPNGQPSPQWPGGHGNLGLAHGIAGPLALLSTAMRRRITVPGQADAIDRICAHLDAWRCDASGSAWWPGTLTRREWQTSAARQHGPHRPSWCYGTPGLTRAQQLAGLALNDPPRQLRAEADLVACVSDERQLSQLNDASLCHGWAGVLHTVSRAAGDAAPDSPLSAHLLTLRKRLRRHLAAHGPPTDQGFLEGAAGVRLAHYAATSDTPPATRWDACLLLAG